MYLKLQASCLALCFSLVSLDIHSVGLQSPGQPCVLRFQDDRKHSAFWKEEQLSPLKNL